MPLNTSTRQTFRSWDNVLFSSRNLIPTCSGIYVIADPDGTVWYVGQAINLKSRWAGKSHHRYMQLMRSHHKLSRKIYWKQVNPQDLDRVERECIEQFQPELNATRVKKTLPTASKTENEIKRLVKVLNKQTLLFPILRSVVVGGYQEDEFECIIIVVNFNDQRDIIQSSIRKRCSPQVRQAWKGYETYCGRDESEYCPLCIPCYLMGNICIEFLAIPEVIDYLAENEKVRDHYVGYTEIFGVRAAALLDLSFLNALSLKEELSFYSGTEKSLQLPLYLKYRRPILNSMASAIKHS